MKAGFISLGCSKNLVDTEVMLGILKEHGIEITNKPAEADILIVNTCAFIQSAKDESITTVLNMAEYKESGRCRSLGLADLPVNGHHGPGRVDNGHQGEPHRDDAQGDHHVLEGIAAHDFFEFFHAFSASPRGLPLSKKCANTEAYAVA